MHIYTGIYRNPISVNRRLRLIHFNRKNVLHNISCCYRKRLEAEKSQSYETWLAQREVEKKKVEFQRQKDDLPLAADRGPGALRAYLRSLGKTRAGDTYEDWLDQKETELDLYKDRVQSAKSLTA